MRAAVTPGGSRRVHHEWVHRTKMSNVLVIGTGAAGCRAAIAATDAGVQVLLPGKRARLDAHTVLASGGINAALAAWGVVARVGIGGINVAAVNADR